MEPTDNNSLEPTLEPIEGSYNDAGESSVSLEAAPGVHVGEVGPPSKRRMRMALLHYNGKALMLAGIVLSIITLITVFSILVLGKSGKQPVKLSVIDSYAARALPLGKVKVSSELQLGDTSTLSVNGQLRVSNGLVLLPSSVPSAPVTGQLYYDQATNAPYYFDGNKFISLAPTVIPAHVTSLGGVGGSIGLSSDLQIANGGQLALSDANSQTLGSLNQGHIVTSLQGQTGAVTLSGGSGIAISGTTITNSGVVSLSGTPNQVSVSSSTGAIQLSLPQDIAPTSSPTFATPTVAGLVFTNTGNGNIATVQGVAGLGQNTTYILPDPGFAMATICISNGNCAGSGGGVTSVGGTANTIALFTGGQTIANSILSQDAGATTLTVAGSVAINGQLHATGDIATAGQINATGNITSGGQLSATGNINTGGQYQVNGTQISSANLSNDANLAKLDGTGPQQFTGNNAFSGTVLVRNASDSTAAFQIQDALGTSNLFTADTTHNLVGIGTAGPGYKLDVVGDINTTTLYRVGGVPISSANLSNDAQLAKTNGDQTFSGVNSFTNAGNSFVGNGSGLTALNADNITTGTLTVAHGGTGVNGSAAANGQLLIGNGSGFSLATLTAGSGITVTNSAGGIQINAPNAGSCVNCANVSLSNLNNVAINTSLLTGTSSIDLGSRLNPFRDLYLGGTASNNLQLTAPTVTAPRTITLPDASGTVAVSASGNIALSNSGGISFTGQLPIANGGTNSTALPIVGGLAYGDGSGYAFTSFGVLGQVVISGGAGAPSYQNLASLLGAGSNIAISGTTTPTIGVIASPSFTNVTASGTLSVQGANSLSLGTASNLGSIAFHDGATANSGTLRLAGNLSGAASYQLPVGTGTQTLCTIELGNCAGSGAGVTGTGNVNRLAKFTADGQNIGNSNITDDGTAVTISTGALIQGSAGLTLGTTGVTGKLVLKNSTNSNTLSLQAGTTSGNLTFTLPTADGNANDCLKTNGSGGWIFAACTGGAGGGVTSVNSLSGVLTVAGTANEITVNSSAGTITLATPQDIATTSDVNFHDLSLSGTNAAIVTNASAGAVSNLIDLKVNGVSQFSVAPNGNITATGTFNGQSLTISDITATGNINTTGGAIQTNSISRIDHNGNLVNIGTITSGDINGQTISSAANFTGTLHVNGTLRVDTLGTVGATAVCYNGSNQLATCATTGAGATYVQGGNSFGATATLGTNDNNSLQLRTNGATALTILTNGNVGIGTATPGSKLEVAGTGFYAGNLTVGTTTTPATISSPGAGTNSEHFGAGSTAGGTSGLAIGNGATTGTTLGSTAVGFGAQATGGSGNTALGYNSQATASGGNGLALGNQALASGDNSIALGALTSTAGFGNAIVLGQGAVATAGNQLVVTHINSAYFGQGVTIASPVAFTLQGTGGSGTDNAGATFNLAGGKGTGAGAGGNINLQIAKPGTTGSTLNSLTTVESLNGSTGAALFQNATDSGTAFQIQNQAGTSNLFVADTTHNRIGIATATPGYPLDVAGDINTSGVYRIGGVAICTSTGCTSAGGSGNYIQNNSSATPQVANFNIQSVAAGSIAALVQGATSATQPVLVVRGGATPGTGGDLLQAQDSTGAVLTKISATGAVTAPSVTALTLTATNNGTNNVTITAGSAPDIYSSTGILRLQTFSPPGSGVQIFSGLSVFGINGTIAASAGNGTSAGAVLGVAGGKGGNTIGTTGQVAGTGGAATILGGAGGDAPSGSTNGSGGSINIQGGGPGAGAGAAGSYGILILQNSGGNVGIGNSTPGARLQINTGAVGTIGQIIKATASQTADLLQFQDSNGANLLNVTSGGNLNLAATSATGGQITQGGLRLIHTTGGNTNFFAGINAGNLTQTGTSNTAVGNSALLANTSGFGNTAVGAGTLQSNTTGAQNTALGQSALLHNTGDNNVALGFGALAANLAGTQNAATGTNALLANTSGSFNVATGQSALSSNTAGNVNTAIGYQAGLTQVAANANISGTNNTFLGASSGPGTTNQLQNATSLGTYATVNNSNALALGCAAGVNGCATTTNVGIGVADVQSRLQVQSNATTGTGTITSVGTAVTGTSTTFTTQAKVGDTIIAASQARRITAIGSDTGLTIDTAFAADLSAATAFTFTTPVTTISNTGATLFRNSTNSTNAFQIQNAAGTTTLFNVNTTSNLIGITTASPATQLANTSTIRVDANSIGTTGGGLTWAVNANGGYAAEFANGGGGANANGLLAWVASADATTRILTASNSNVDRFVVWGNGNAYLSGNLGIGTNAPGNKLSVNAITTADSLAQASIGTGVATNKGLVIQGVASQTADLLQLQNSSGTVLSKVDANGVLSAVGLSVDRTNGGFFTGIRVPASGNLLEVLQSATVRGGFGPSGGFFAGATSLPVSTGNIITNIIGATATALVVQGFSGQTADLLQLQNSSGNVVAGFNASGQLNLGRASNTVGQINLFGSGSANAIALVGPTAPGSGLTLTLPNETGTLCSTGSVCTGYAPSAGSGSYINNNTTSQTANFNIQSAAVGSIGGIIEGAVGQTADLLQLQNSSAVSVLRLSAVGTISTQSGIAFTNQSATALAGPSVNGTGDGLLLTAGATNGVRINNSTNGAELLRVTNAGQVGIGTATFGTSNKLLVNPYSTVDSLATAQINTNAATNKGLVIQGVASQTANLLELQNNTGTVTTKIDSTGIITANTYVAAGLGTSFVRLGGTTLGGGLDFISDQTFLGSTGGGTLSLGSGGTATKTKLVVIGNASQSTNNLFELQDSSLNVIASFNGTGQLNLGRASNTVGQINLFGSGSANAIALVGPTSPGSGLTLTLPNETGTLCSTGSVCTGYAPSTGSGSYIQNNSSATPQTANFNIQSVTASNVGGIIRAAASQTADLLQLQNSSGTVLSKFDANGVLGGANGSGSNIAGSALTIAGGRGTGTGVGGNILFQYSPAGSSSSNANALQTACTISGTNGSLSCPGAGTNSEHFGAGSTAAGNGALALGNGAIANGINNSIAIGLGATTTTSVNSGSLAIAIGSSASATYRGIALGGSANSSADGAIAIGQGAIASANSAIALGPGATAANTASIAIGGSATTTAANQLVIGGPTSSAAQIQNVFIGNGVTAAVPTGFTLQGTGGSGTDIAGASVNLAGGKGTGAGAGGTINFQIAKPGTSGSTLNGLTTVESINGTTGATLFQNATDSGTAFQIQNAAGTSNLFVADTTNSRIGIGALPATSLLTVGTNTTAASSGITFGTDTDLYRSAASTLKTDGTLQVASGAFINSINIGTNAAGEIGTTTGTQLTLNTFNAAGTLARNGLTVTGLNGTVPSQSGNGTAAAAILTASSAKGGNTTGTTGQVAGAGGTISLTSGIGGDAPSGSTNGNGGAITLQGGSPGVGAGAAGSYGNLLLQTSGGNVGIGTATPGNKLSVNAITIADSLAQATIGTGVATNKGLIIQGVASQTASGLQIQGSDGTPRTDLNPFVANGSSAVAYTLDTANTLSTAGSKLLSLRNAGTEKLYVDGTGALGGFSASGINGVRLVSTLSQVDLNFIDSSNVSRSIRSSGGTLLVGFNPGTAASPLTLNNGLNNTVYVAKIKGVAIAVGTQTGNLLELYKQDADANTVLNVSANGVLNFGAGGATATDTNLYRSAANTLKTDNSLVVATNFTGNGTALFKNSADSTTAFQIQSAGSATPVFNVDTTSGGKVGIGTAAPGNLLSIGALAVPSAGAQIAVATGGATNSGIVVQTVAGQSAGNILQAQDSTGAVLATLDYQGNLTVKNTVINGTLTVNGHFITGSAAPTAPTAQVAAGTGSPTCAITGNDTSGTITVVTGTIPIAGTWCTFTINFGTAPRPVVSGFDQPSAALLPYMSATTTTFTFGTAGGTPANGTTYKFNYFNAQ